MHYYYDENCTKIHYKTCLRDFMPRGFFKVENPQILIMVELSLRRIGKLSSKYPQLSTKLMQGKSLATNRPLSMSVS